MDEPEEEAGVPEWVVTYGDMMSLLLTFFIMLVSMSEIKSDDGETRRMMDAIRQAFGPTKYSMSAPGSSPQKSSMFGKQSSTGIRSRGGVQRGGTDSKGSSGEKKTVARMSEGTLIVLGGSAQFRRFDARLTEDLKAKLDAIAGVVGPKPNQIMIRGHASPEPLPTDTDLAAPAFGGSFRWPNRLAGRLFQHDGLPLENPFDLSFARARAVAEYLVSKGIPRRRLIITAAGDSELRFVTRKESSQQWNRRVDVFLLDAYITPPPSPR